MPGVSAGIQLSGSPRIKESNEAKHTRGDDGYESLRFWLDWESIRSVIEASYWHAGNLEPLLARPQFGLANRISDAIATLDWREPESLTDVRNSDELLLACDFSGSHKTADFEAFAFLVGAIAGSAAWMEQRAHVRKNFFGDGRRMSYKSLNDTNRQKALLPFLAAANLYPGNLFVFLVSKQIPKMFSDPGDQILFPELVVAERKWKRKSFQRLLLIATLGAILVSGLSGYSQDILWLIDQDDIAPNPERHSHAGHVIHHCISTYAPASTGKLIFITTEANVNNRMTEDVVAIPDLAAGCIVEVFGAYGRSPQATLWTSPSARVSPKSKLILDWFADDSQPLRRIVIALDYTSQGSLTVSAFRPVRGHDGRVFLLR